MFNKSGINKETAVNVRQILFDAEHFMSVSILCSATGAVNGKLLAGTPMAGSLANRTVAFVKSATPVGVLLHDVDVSKGSANGTLLLHGAINLDRVDPAIKADLTAAADALPNILMLADK